MKMNEQILDEMCFVDDKGNPLPKSDSQWIEWISVGIRVPSENTDCLISDGVNVGFGYFVAEYEAEDPKDPTQYSSEHWIQEGLVLCTCCSGFPKVTHWMPLPQPPKE